MGLLDRKAARAEVAELARSATVSVSMPTRSSAGLSVGVRQRVEILKALYRRARILILDEPTAVLTPQESEGLFAVMRRARGGGTHDPLRHPQAERGDGDHRRRDRAARRARRRAHEDERDDAGEIVRAMTGRNVNTSIERGAARPGAPLLEVERLTVAGAGGRPLVDAAAFAVRAGEIVGVAGVAGNGQNELVEALVGLRRPDAGEVRVAGREVTNDNVARHRAAGLAYVPEDRATVGAALAATRRREFRDGLSARPAALAGRLVDREAMASRARGADRKVRRQELPASAPWRVRCPAAICRRWWSRGNSRMRRAC